MLCGTSGGNPDRPLLVAIGEVLWDVFDGRVCLGGAPANVAVHAAALGMRAALISCVGADGLGRRARVRLGELGVETDWVMVHQERPTGTVPVTLCNGQPTYEIANNVAWDALAWCEGLTDLADAANVVCFGTLAQRSVESREAIWRFLQCLRPGCLRVLDVNFRQRYHSEAVVRASLEFADVLKLNESEVPLLRHYAGGPEDADVFLEAIREEFGLRLVVLTLGERGCRVFGAEGMVVSAGHSQRVVDAVGAGDAFTAAFAGCLLAGFDLQACADSANVAGAFVVGQEGATPGLPERLRIF